MLKWLGTTAAAIGIVGALLWAAPGTSQAAGSLFPQPGNAGVAVPPGNAGVAVQPGNTGPVTPPGGIGSGAIGAAGAGNALKPYLFSPPPVVVTPLEQESATEYRMQLKTQEQRLEQLQAMGALDNNGRRILAQTRAEIARMDGVLRP